MNKIAEILASLKCINNRVLIKQAVDEQADDSSLPLYGAAIGGLGGLVANKVLGRKSKQIPLDALMGAVAGGLGGVGYGLYHTPTAKSTLPANQAKALETAERLAPPGGVNLKPQTANDVLGEEASRINQITPIFQSAGTAAVIQGGGAGLSALNKMRRIGNSTPGVMAASEQLAGIPLDTLTSKWNATANALGIGAPEKSLTNSRMVLKKLYESDPVTATAAALRLSDAAIHPQAVAEFRGNLGQSPTSAAISNAVRAPLRAADWALGRGTIGYQPWGVSPLNRVAPEGSSARFVLNDMQAAGRIAAKSQLFPSTKGTGARIGIGAGKFVGLTTALELFKSWQQARADRPELTRLLGTINPEDMTPEAANALARFIRQPETK